MSETLNWNHFAILLGIIAGWSLVIIATARWAISTGLKGIQENLALSMKQIDDKLAAQDGKVARAAEAQQDLERKAAGEMQKVEREVLQIKADLPLCYVRREDFIRHEVVINTKLDRLRDLIPRDKESKGEDE